MIAWITICSGLVPLIEGLCAQVSESRFEIIGDLRSHLLLFFFERENMWKRREQLVQDSNPAASMYIHMCTLYTYTNVRMPRFSPSGFFGPSRCLILTPGLNSNYHICAVCVSACVYTHTHTHTLPPALKLEKTQTTALSFLLSKTTPHAKHHTSGTGFWVQSG